ncbi:MAG: squalene--hopene cyclase [Acidobacteriota bacterium]|nr:squalene--hopene cyclase [Blastocatellia bacterium]MDW8413204.1 squalene--hopene cyclase [Acidobacteriota bacterium]
MKTTHTQTVVTALREKVAKAIKKATDYLLSLQYDEGYWWAELEANVTLTAEYVMLHSILGTASERPMKKVERYLLGEQREHGGWELFWGDGGELSTSIEAYFALKLLGMPTDAAEMRAAREFILSRGGLTRARVFTKLHLALFGAYPWEGIPTLPPWIMLLPDWSPFTIYEMASWARSSTVPLLIVCDKKPVWKRCMAEELYVDKDISLPSDGSFLGSAFVVLDKILKLVEKFNFVPGRQEALRLAEKWTLEHQDETGDWAGIIPAMLNSLLALHCLGYDPRHPVMAKGLAAIDRFAIETEDQLHIQPCVSPVWDTGLVSIALLDGGLKPDHPAIVRAGEWLLSKQILRKGDWAVKNKSGEPGGWAFEFYNDFYPDVDDTAVIIMALSRMKLPDETRKHKAIQRAIKWILSMQNSNGSWAAFDIDNNLEILNKIPYGDLKAMIDPGTADLTARVLEMLGRTKYAVEQKVVERAKAFLKQTQEPEGCWYGRWGVNYIYGTSGVLNGLTAIGVDPHEAYLMRAVQWLNSIQNEDGGWGESCNSYVDRNLMGQGKSTASQTAWAILGLIAAGEARSEAVRRGIEYLAETQTPEGCWIEREFTGTGFPGHFYINYHLYRNHFPLMALGRYLNA